MSTPGNTNTVTEMEVLNQIREELFLVDGLSIANVFIVAEAIFLGTAYIGDEYVQIVPGVAVDTGADVGNGLVSDEVKVVSYNRLLTDQSGDDSQKMANESQGLLELVERINTKLVQNFLRGKLVSPLVPVRREPGQPVPLVGFGWATVQRVFKCQYVQPFPAPQSVTS